MRIPLLRFGIAGSLGLLLGVVSAGCRPGGPGGPGPANDSCLAPICATAADCPAGWACVGTLTEGVGGCYKGITCGAAPCNASSVCCVGGTFANPNCQETCASGDTYSCSSSANCGGSKPICCAAVNGVGEGFGQCTTAAFCSSNAGTGGGPGSTPDVSHAVQLCASSAECPAGLSCQPTQLPGQSPDVGGFMACVPGALIACGNTQCTPAQGCCPGLQSSFCGDPGEDCGPGSPIFTCTGSVNCGGTDPICCYSTIAGFSSGGSCSTLQACGTAPQSLQLCRSTAECPTGQVCQPVDLPDLPGVTGFSACGVPSIACDTTTCETSQGCCIDGSTGVAACGVAGACPSSPATAFSDLFLCSGSATCSAGEVCCALPAVAPLHGASGSACQALPCPSMPQGMLGTPFQAQICATDAECPSGQCQPSPIPIIQLNNGNDVINAGFNVCAQPTVPATIPCGSLQCNPGQVCCVSPSGATKCAATCDSPGCSPNVGPASSHPGPSYDASMSAGDSNLDEGAPDAALDSTLGPFDASSEGGPGEFDGPSGSDASGSGDSSGFPAPEGLFGIAVDVHNYVFVVATNGIFVFNQVFQLVQVVSPEADAGGGVLSPNGLQGIAVDGANHVLVVNSYETADPNGCFYVAPGPSGSDVARYLDNSSNAMPPLSLDTVLIGSPNKTPLSCAIGVAVQPDGTVFVAPTAGFIAVFDSAGNAITSGNYPSASGLNVSAIAVDPTSTYVYAADFFNGVVYQYQYAPNQLDASASALTLVKSISVNGGSSEPVSVAVDGTGNVYVDDLLSHLVYVYSSAGASMGTIQGCPTAGGSLAFDMAGRLYIACRSGEVRMYTMGSNGMWPAVGTVIVQ